MAPEVSHISVCICTYKRPTLLKHLLETLQNQKTDGSFDYSIVVVDNDNNRSAESTVADVQTRSSIAITYDVEPEQNISLARNRSVRNAKGDFVAFIDDDEFAVNDWLLSLYKACNKYKADGVLGPVKPHFETQPPKWIVKGRLFERPSHETGAVLEWRNTRTGNVLLRRDVLEESGIMFDPAFGRGGSDRELFKRMIERGHVFVWCDEAPVYETVPPERWRRTFMLRRALLRGELRSAYPSCFGFSGVPKSLIAFSIYTLALPFLFLIGHHLFMKCLIRDCDHLGRLLAVCGIHVIKEKYVTK